MLVDNLWRRRKRPESQLPEKRFGCHFGRAEAEPVAGSRDQVSNKDGVQVTTGKVEMNSIKNSVSNPFYFDTDPYPFPMIKGPDPDPR